MKKKSAMFLAVLLFAVGGCKKSGTEHESVYQLFPGTPPVPPTTTSANCDGIGNANPLPAYVSGKGWLPYREQVFCNRMDDHWQKIRIPGYGRQDIKGCNYFLMPEYNAKPVQGRNYSNRYYPDESHFQSWFAVYAVAPMQVNGKPVRVPVITSPSLVRRDNIAWAQFMGDPRWRDLVGKPGSPSTATCARKSGDQCVLWRTEFDIPSHLDMGCCNWTRGPFPNTYKVFHDPQKGCFPNPCADSPTGTCTQPRKNCSVKTCANCTSPIWRGTVKSYQKQVRHTIISYQWYIGDWLMLSIATGVIFTKNNGETVNTFEKFPDFKKELESMTRTITVYYDSKKPFTCSPTTRTDAVGLTKK